MADLFDCSPRIAAKLARCEEIARTQLLASREPGNYAPWQDYEILQRLQRRWFFGERLERQIRDAYQISLNA